MDSDDTRRLRAAGEGRTPPAPAGAMTGSRAFVGKVTTASASIAAGTFLTVNPADVTGAETQGSAGTIAAGTQTVPVYMIGPGTPATGDNLICRFVSYRWVAARRTPAAPPNPCPTTFPKVLTWNGTISPYAQIGSFQVAPASSPEPTYTLTYGPTPGAIASPLAVRSSQTGGIPGRSTITMPDSAWFSAGFTAKMNTSISVTAYLYLYIANCQAEVGLIVVPYPATGSLTAAPAAISGVFLWGHALTTASPFVMTAVVTEFGIRPTVTGTHGADDVTAGTGGNLGQWS